MRATAQTSTDIEACAPIFSSTSFEMPKDTLARQHDGRELFGSVR